MGMSRGETGTFIVLMPLAVSRYDPPANFAKNSFGKSAMATAPAPCCPSRSLRNPSGQASERSHLEIQSRRLEFLPQHCSTETASETTQGPGGACS